MTIQKMPTEDNLVDSRTKVMTTAKFKHCLDLLHVEVWFKEQPIKVMMTRIEACCTMLEV